MSFEALPVFDVASVPSFYGESAAAASTDAQAGLSQDYRFARRISKRTAIDATRVANAAKHLQRLPGRDEDIHIAFRGNFDAFDLTPAVLELAQVNAEELLVATLGFNERGTARLLDLLDTGRIRSCWFLVSVYFQGACRLRSCRNVEQAMITESPDLYAFHRSWMDELFSQEGQK